MYSNEYNKLTREINRFIDLIELIENTLIGFSNVNQKCFSLKIEIIDKIEAEAVFKSMKSNVIIMLYNLVESSIRSTMYYYYERFNAQKCTYSSTIVELKKLWINHRAKNFKVNETAEQVFELIENSIDTEYSLALNFDKNFSLSGNADVRELKRILDTHGLKYQNSQFDECGLPLKNIKDMRNNLAHGNISFEDNGKKITASDLLHYKEQTYQCIEYFMDIVNNSAVNK